MGHTTTDNPCGEFGPTQKKALVWFFAALIVGVSLVINLATIDRWMYDNNGEMLDYRAYRENRSAQTSLRSESVDPRMDGSLSHARQLEADTNGH